MALTAPEPRPVSPRGAIAGGALGQSSPPRLISATAELILKGVLRHLCGITVEPPRPPPSRPLMVCANHRSHADSVAVMMALGLGFRDCGLLAAKDYFFDVPWRRHLASSVFTLLPFERRLTVSGYRWTLAACEQFLDHGGRVIIAYPEGGRGSTLRSFHRAPARLALSLSLPVMPVHIDGTDRVMPKGRRLIRLAPVRVHLGTPIAPETIAPDQPMALRSQLLTMELFHAVARLGGVAPAAPSLAEPRQAILEGAVP